MSSVCVDKDHQPDDEALAAILGRSKLHWDAVLAHLRAEYPALSHDWKFYGKKHGWQLKVMGKRKAFLYMIPHQGSFLAGMALRPAELERLRSARVPAALIAEIEAEKAYPEGQPARLEVRTKPHFSALLRLLSVRDY